jgi:hypothetical protein
MVIAIALAWPVSPLAAAGAPQRSGGPAPAFKILVIEGENAVNIVQQKTAVAPIIEVRDSNDLPVSGAAVTFTVLRGGATFNGSSTLTVVTNAAGRATAEGFAPTRSGALQLRATTSFGGRTQTVTIAQTNVANAAAAGGAGSTAAAAAASSAGATGGGLGGAAIAVIVGGAAGGVLIAAKAAGVGGGSTMNQNPRCTFSVSPTSITFPREGGSVLVTVTISPGPCDTPAWTASTISSFITLAPAAASGSGIVTATAAPYPFFTGGPPLTGNLQIAEQIIPFVQ